MGLFGSKKKKTEDAAVELQDGEVLDPKEQKRREKEAKKQAKKNKSKRKGGLAKILDESVWESVHEDLKANKPFIVEDEYGNSKYIALLFDTNDIGGLAGKEAKKDESKGSIIEAVRIGRIKTYIRPELLDEDLFVIIPDAETIDNMDEFVLLTEVSYVLCSINDDGEILTETERGSLDEDDPEIKVTFQQVHDLIIHGEHVSSLIPYLSGDTYGGGDADASYDMDDIPEELELDDDGEEIEDLPEDDILSADDGDDDLQPLDDPVEDLDDLNPDDDLTGDEMLDDDALNQPDQDFDADPVANQGSPVLPNGMPDYSHEYSGNDQGGYDEYGDVNEDVIKGFEDENVYSRELHFDPRRLSENFDSLFLNDNNSYIRFDENRGTGWLNEYLSSMSKDANRIMEQKHNDNLARLRERYMSLMRDHWQSILEQLDYNNPNTQFGQMYMAIERNKADNMASLDRVVAMKREQLESVWEHRLKQEEDAAALLARNKYIDKNGAKHDREIAEIERNEQIAIETDYNISVAHMNRDRQAQADMWFETASAQTLKDLSKIYMEQLQDESRFSKRLQAKLMRFIDDNRKDEKARIEVIAEENRQVKKANEVRRDYTAKIKALAAEAEMKQAMLQADIDRLSREHEVEIENKQNEWANKFAQEKEKSDNLQNKVDELLEKYSQLDDKKGEAYSSRIAELENLVKSKDDDMDRIETAHKRSNLITIFLLVAITIAACGIGFMIGTITDVRKQSKTEIDQVYDQYVQDQQTLLNSTPAPEEDNGQSVDDAGGQVTVEFPQ